MSLPVAITVSGPGRLYFDLEFVPTVVDRPRDVTLTVNPGFLWRLGRGFAAGSRVGFDIKSSSFGVTPLVVKSFPIEHSFFFQGLLRRNRLCLSLRPAACRALHQSIHLQYGLRRGVLTAQRLEHGLDSLGVLTSEAFEVQTANGCGIHTQSFRFDGVMIGSVGPRERYGGLWARRHQFPDRYCHLPLRSNY